MASDGESLNRSVPTLAQCCQRVAAKHVEYMSGLGDIPYDLVKPILQHCSAETLLRLESDSPRLQKDTEELWRDQCFSRFRGPTEQYRHSATPSPGSWRKLYDALMNEEKERLEAAGNKLRIQRLEANESKKEREVKFIDRAPPQKRPRWGPQPPKTLFQKTRTEASKIQKNMYTSRAIPPMIKGRDYRPISLTPVGDLLPKPSTSYNSRVTVSTVIRRQSVSSQPSVTACSSPITNPNTATTVLSPQPLPSPQPFSRTNNPSVVSNTQNAKEQVTSPLASTQSPSKHKPPISAKKDLMATLFVPKHKAYSQLQRAK